MRGTVYPAMHTNHLPVVSEGIRESEQHASWNPSLALYAQGSNWQPSRLLVFSQ